MDRIIKHTIPLEDDEQAFLIREALAAVVIRRAQKAEGTFTPSDEGVDRELSRLPAPIAAAQNPAELREALLAMSKDWSVYSDEELEL